MGGYLGNGSDTYSRTPVTPIGLDAGVTQIDSNWNHSCALKGGKAYCWGDPNNGRLGEGRPIGNSLPLQLTPVEVIGLSNITAIGVGRSHTCAIVADKQRWCWGANDHGQLGNDTVSGSSSVPVPVIGSSPKPPVVVKPTVVVTPKPKPPVAKPTPKPAAPQILFSPSARTINRRRVVTVATLICPAGAACKVTLPTTVAFKIKRKSFTFGVAAPKLVRSGRRANVTVKLSSKAAKRLQGRVATVKLTIKLGSTTKTVKQKITAPAPRRTAHGPKRKRR